MRSEKYYRSGETENRNKHHRGRDHHGPDSLWMHDPKIIFDKLQLKEGDVFIDLGCGIGNYALAAADIVGEKGQVYAIDRISSWIEALNRISVSKNMPQLEAVYSDISINLPLDNESSDVCFLSTVLHALNMLQCSDTLFNEIYRILKPSGKLFIIECKKQDSSFGPPIQVRISPKELDEIVCPYGFIKTELTDLGYNYIAEYKKL